MKERRYLRRVLFRISGDMEGEEQVKAIWHCVFSPRGEAMEEEEGCHGNERGENGGIRLQ